MIKVNEVNGLERQNLARQINKCYENLMYGVTLVCYYNGLYELASDMVIILKEAKPYKNYSITRPDSIGDPNSLMGILWSILVVNFGDYGTSPRYGWIECEHLDECIDFLYLLEAAFDKGIWSSIDLNNIDTITKTPEGKYELKDSWRD